MQEIMNSPNEPTEINELYKVELEAHPLWLELRVVVDGKKIRHEEIRWEDIEKIRTKATEAWYFDMKRYYNESV